MLVEERRVALCIGEHITLGIVFELADGLSEAKDVLNHIILGK